MKLIFSNWFCVVSVVLGNGCIPIESKLKEKSLISDDIELCEIFIFILFFLIRVKKFDFFWSTIFFFFWNIHSHRINMFWQYENRRIKSNNKTNHQHYEISPTPPFGKYSIASLLTVYLWWDMEVWERCCFIK